jgi:hypothetical protein
VVVMVVVMVVRLDSLVDWWCIPLVLRRCAQLGSLVLQAVMMMVMVTVMG